MNYLAHAYLAGPIDEVRLGNLISDFVKGRIADAPFGTAVRHGLWMHRQVDMFVDAHPAFLASRARFAPERSRVAGIVVDLVYDHFLAAEWADHHPAPLAHYTADIYSLFADHAHILPVRFQPVAARMTEYDWLSHYAHPDGLAAAIRGVSRRLSRAGHHLADCQQDVDRHYADLRSDFHRLLPDAIAHARQLQLAVPPLAPS